MADNVGEAHSADRASTSGSETTGSTSTSAAFGYLTPPPLRRGRLPDRSSLVTLTPALRSGEDAEGVVTGAVYTGSAFEAHRAATPAYQLTTAAAAAMREAVMAAAMKAALTAASTARYLGERKSLGPGARAGAAAAGFSTRSRDGVLERAPEGRTELAPEGGREYVPEGGREPTPEHGTESGRELAHEGGGELAPEGAKRRRTSAAPPPPSPPPPIACVPVDAGSDQAGDARQPAPKKQKQGGGETSRTPDSERRAAALEELSSADGRYFYDAALWGADAGDKVQCTVCQWMVLAAGAAPTACGLCHKLTCATCVREIVLRGEPRCPTCRAPSFQPPAAVPPAAVPPAAAAPAGESEFREAPRALPAPNEGALAALAALDMRCPGECGTRAPPQLVWVHLRDDACPAARICECGHVFARAAEARLREHWAMRCERGTAPCELCALPMPRYLHAEHRRTACLLAEVECCYGEGAARPEPLAAGFSCSWEGARAQLEEHLASCTVHALVTTKIRYQAVLDAERRFNTAHVVALTRRLAVSDARRAEQARQLEGAGWVEQFACSPARLDGWQNARLVFGVLDAAAASPQLLPPSLPPPLSTLLPLPPLPPLPLPSSPSAVTVVPSLSSLLPQPQSQPQSHLQPQSQLQLQLQPQSTSLPPLPSLPQAEGKETLDVRPQPVLVRLQPVLVRSHPLGRPRVPDAIHFLRCHHTLALTFARAQRLFVCLCGAEVSYSETKAVVRAFAYPGGEDDATADNDGGARARTVLRARFHEPTGEYRLQLSPSCGPDAVCFEFSRSSELAALLREYSTAQLRDHWTAAASTDGFLL